MIPHHEFRRVTFDFSVRAEADADPLQDRLSHFSDARLASVIDQSIRDAAVEKDLVLDRLMLDLGDLTLEDFDDTLEERLREALTLALQQAQINETTGERHILGPKTRDPAPDQATDLEHYLITGRYLNFHGDNMPGLAALLESELRRAPQEVVSLLGRIAHDTAVHVRLKMQLPERLRQDLIAAARRHANGSLSIVLDLLTAQSDADVLSSTNGLDHTISPGSDGRLSNRAQHDDRPKRVAELKGHSSQEQSRFWQALRRGDATHTIQGRDLDRVLADASFDHALFKSYLPDPDFREAIRVRLSQASLEALHLRFFPAIGGFAVTLLKTVRHLQPGHQHDLLDASIASLEKTFADAVIWLKSVTSGQSNAVLNEICTEADRLARSEERFVLLRDIARDLGGEISDPARPKDAFETDYMPGDDIITFLKHGKPTLSGSQVAYIVQSLADNDLAIRRAIADASTSTFVRQRLMSIIRAAPQALIEQQLPDQLGQSFATQFQVIKAALTDANPVESALFNSLSETIVTHSYHVIKKASPAPEALRSFLSSLSAHAPEAPGALCRALWSDNATCGDLAAQDTRTAAQEIIKILGETQATTSPAANLPDNARESTLARDLAGLLGKAGFSISTANLLTILRQEFDAEARNPVTPVPKHIDHDPGAMPASHAPPETDKLISEPVFTHLSEMFVLAGLSNDKAGTERAMRELHARLPFTADRIDLFFETLSRQHDVGQSDLTRQLAPHVLRHRARFPAFVAAYFGQDQTSPMVPPADPETVRYFQSLLSHSGLANPATDGARFLYDKSASAPITESIWQPVLSALARELDLTLSELAGSLETCVFKPSEKPPAGFADTLRIILTEHPKDQASDNAPFFPAQALVAAGLCPDIQRATTLLSAFGHPPVPDQTFFGYLTKRLNMDTEDLKIQLGPHFPDTVKGKLPDDTKTARPKPTTGPNHSDAQSALGASTPGGHRLAHDRAVLADGIAETPAHADFIADPGSAEAMCVGHAPTDDHTVDRIMKRLARQLSVSPEALIDAMNKGAVGAKDAVSESLLQFLNQPPTHHANQPRHEEFLLQLAHLLSRSGITRPPQGIFQILVTVAQTAPPTSGNENTFLAVLAEKLDLSSKTLVAWLKTLAADQPDDSLKRFVDSLDRHTLVRNVPEAEPGREARDELSDLTKAPVHTGMSGLVLTHPYLATYLDRLNCLKDGTLPAKNMDRAVHLFALLATGEDNLPEHELALPKLLAGLATNAPVSHGFNASPEETALANELLGHLASQVPGFINTTPDALRETFLMRHGQIVPSPEGTGLVLQVVKGPFDMLLDQVPWPFSIVRLPWMREAVQVEWI